MKELNWNRYTEQPQPVFRTRFGGQWEYHFNYIVKHVGDEYLWLSVVTSAGVWNKGAIIRAIIRQRYTEDDVEAIIGNVLNNPNDKNHVSEYKALQEWRAMAKKAAEDCMAWGEANGVCEEPTEQEEEPVEVPSSLLPDGMEMLAQALSLVKTQAQELPDEQAAEVPALFPAWADFIGQQVEADKRLFYAGRLWKVLHAHTIQAEWTPDVVPALFTEVVVQGEGEPELGTLDNPIAYNGNMELEEGKYYLQDGVVYKCIRSTGTPVYHPLSALIGLYVEVA